MNGSPDEGGTEITGIASSVGGRCRCRVPGYASECTRVNLPRVQHLCWRGTKWMRQSSTAGVGTPRAGWFRYFPKLELERLQWRKARATAARARRTSYNVRSKSRASACVLSEQLPQRNPPRRIFASAASHRWHKAILADGNELGAQLIAATWFGCHDEYLRSRGEN